MNGPHNVLVMCQDMQFLELIFNCILFFLFRVLFMGAITIHFNR
ncbi:hypothetical protein HMPREF3192_00227 [Atopobium deltae]|uniref:Uncharacterized protein n=1 Tax=Atopobium deltae TaxID=1393034 RepID=A0A133XX94_9ACTN|nr:hypothetical protein HMPREF3192_00227 [Atopobium deltae]